MTKVFLAAGVAALAISAPASAGPGGHAGAQTTKAERTKTERTAKADRTAQRSQSTERRAARTERVAARSTTVERPARVERQAPRVDRQAARAERPSRVDNRMAVREQARTDRTAIREQGRTDRVAARDQVRADRVTGRPLRIENAQGYGVGGCPPGLAKKPVACLPPGQAAKLGLNPAITTATAATLRTARVDRLNRRLGMNLAAPATAVTLLGMPVSQANAILPLSAVPQPISYLYPSTNDYYYRYGDGYIYQVDSGSNLISMLIPLLAGGYLPGQYLPSNYMNSYMPSSYGFNSFYPDSPYQCTRYANGMIYYVDCVTGMIENVMPVYNSGYGVGQMLPSSYGYYNVPYQYRDMYYNTSDYNYWYAPGAIYQYDPESSLITSVAALLSPGMTVGQPLPMGYSAYNVPLDYRATYYDTPNDWYRYSNGYVYRVDPTTQLVSAIVASILT